MYQLLFQSPLGPLTLSGTEEAVTALSFGALPGAGDGACPLLEEAARELDAYFQGRRRTFAVPLAPAGTPFQQRVWAELREIPFGATASYGEIAARIGNPRACRAVGMANHRNPIAILIPCHRVVGRSGSLVGYAGGLDIKRALLELEGAAQRRPDLPRVSTISRIPDGNGLMPGTAVFPAALTPGSKSVKMNGIKT